MQHAIYKSHTFFCYDLSLYSFICITRFLMLDLFFTSAEMLMFLKVFFLLFDSNRIAVFSAKIVSIYFLHSSEDPGNIQHFLVDNQIEYGYFLFALPLEKAPSFCTTFRSINATLFPKCHLSVKYFPVG